ncbi:MAG: tetratricopeptide repeat protein, partial [Pseudomonadota bacterium]|nr:tetratricopeptide repeat protein [Pseudomonadota bacterium]
NPAITLNLAILYQQLEQNDAAVAAYESLLETHPENGVALNNLAWLYHQIGDSRSLDIARRAYESSPENGAIADTYGWILFQSGKKAEGIKLLEKAHKLAPESSEIAMHLVEAYRTEGRDNDAQRILKGLEQGNNS